MSTPAGAAPSAIAYAYPWTLHEEGIERAMDTFQSCGIDAVQLAFAYHVGTYLTPRAARGPVRFGDDGALHFDARSAVAGDWPVQPVVSGDVRGAEYGSRPLEVAAERGMRVVAWVVYLYGHALARSRPDLTVRDAFGVARESQLCPSHPTVRAHAHVLTRAVLGLGPLDGFHAESLAYLPYDYGFLNPKSSIAPRARGRHLLGLCFCPHCRSAARAQGVPAEEFAAAVRAWLDEHLNRLPDAASADDDGAWPEDAFDGALSALEEVRRDQVVSLQRAVLSLASAAGLRVGSSTAEAVDHGPDAATVRALRPLVDELRIRVTPGADVRALRAAVATLRADARDGIPIYAFYQLEHFASEPAFASAVERAVEAGLRHHRFYEYSLFSRRQLEWLRGAKHLWQAPGAR